MTVLRFPKSRASVLLVNDSADTREVLTHALEAVGFRVRGVMVDDARRNFKPRRQQSIFQPDVVVYDIGRGGDEEWMRLRDFTELPETKGKPLVITTTNVVRIDGQRDAVYVRSSLQFASTPYDAGDLVARVATAIGLSPLEAGGG